jgi:hypothetical protein
MAKAQRKRGTTKRSETQRRPRQPRDSRKALPITRPQPAAARPAHTVAETGNPQRKEVARLTLELAIGPTILVAIAAVLWHPHMGAIGFKQALELLRRLKPLVGLVSKVLRT